VIKIGQYSLGFLFFFLLWWGASYFSGPSVLPPPEDILSQIVKIEVLSDFFREFSYTFFRAVLGFSLSWIVAFPLGFAHGIRSLI
jgi:ABC-type nitrate/sulfonate/bicarbonate transport system permease component